jgi:tRNA nucleotidyltransferase/poly(A) polymerase
MYLESLKENFPSLDFSWQDDIKEITDLLRDWFFVGGCVRDSLLNRNKAVDIDITTKMSPDEIERAVEGYKTVSIGKKFGTIGVFYKRYQIEITTVRMDIVHYGRRAEVEFGVSFFEDSCRRDFTINALLFNGEVVDFHDGIKDLQDRKVRFIGDPEARIKEDYLRILRYLRFFLTFESGHVSYTYEIQNHLSGLKIVSIERILSEITKMFHIDSRKAIYYLNTLGISQEIFGHQLFMPLHFSNEPLKNLAYSLYFLQNKSLPLSKNVRSLLTLKDRYSDFFMNCAWIWYRKGIGSMRDYISLKKAIGERYSPVTPIENFSVDLSTFQGVQRGEAEAAYRYLLLLNKIPTTQDIFQAIVDMKKNSL